LAELGGCQPKIYPPLLDQTHRELVYRPLQFQKRGQHFISANDETFSGALVVSNSHRSPFGIDS
jgi:predicted membrane GTPase involved in stress response